MEEVCEVCGKPATSWVIDVTRIPNTTLGTYDIIPESKRHYFCSDHKRDSKTYNMNGIEV